MRRPCLCGWWMRAKGGWIAPGPGHGDYGRSSTPTKAGRAANVCLWCPCASVAISASLALLPVLADDRARPPRTAHRPRLQPDRIGHPGSSRWPLALAAPEPSCPGAGQCLAGARVSITCSGPWHLGPVWISMRAARAMKTCADSLTCGVGTGWCSAWHANASWVFLQPLARTP